MSEPKKYTDVKDFLMKNRTLDKENFTHTALGTPPKSWPGKYNITEENSSLFYNLYHNGYSVIDILDNYFIYVKLYDFKNDNIKYEIIKLLCKYITIFHNLHEDEIELALFSNNLHDIILQK